MTALSRVPLLHQPGEAFTYNTAYDILGVLATRISDQPFAHYVHDRILRPLAMTDTGFSYPPEAAGRATTYYRSNDNGTLEVVDPADGQWATEPAFASGPVVTCRPQRTCWRSTGCSSPAEVTCYPATSSRR